MSIPTSFRKAQRTQCKASILIDGLSGWGKTGLALAIARGLVKSWEEIAAVDTENRSMDLYVGQKLHTGVVVEAFNVGDLTAEDGFKPSHYAAFRDLAIKSGYKALICDSISHMWQYEGGILSMVTKLQSSSNALNKYTVWGLPEVVTEKNMIMSLIRNSKIHCINTVRVKEKMEFVTGDDGKTGLKSLGEQQIILPDLKYEPDLVLSMLVPGDDSGRAPKCLVQKSRYAPFKVNEEYLLTAEMIEQLRLFLEEGTSPEVLENMQRDDYVRAITEVLDTNSSAKAIWLTLKEQHNLKDVALKDIPLAKMKVLYSQLVA